jgi:predicted Zn-dependent peptidase
MESDRLQNSVFREFFSERDVVHEERRMRTESSPTGEFDEQFNSMFWQASPYSWPVIGWPSDLNSYTLDEAQRYFNIYYRPNNLVGILVGDFDLAVAKNLINKYFGRLERGKISPPPVPTIEPSQKAPQRLVGEVDAQSEVEVRYHTVPFGHNDSYSLEVMAAILNGRTGRLFKSMVEGDEIATSARVGFNGKKYAGFFSFNATVKGDAQPEDLEEAWYKELGFLKNEVVSELELQKVKNNIIADQYRSLQSNFYLMIQLGFFEMLGGWDYINTASGRLLAVTKEDIVNIANKYFNENNSSVAIYRRSENANPIDGELSRFNPEQLAIIQQALPGLESMPNDQLRTALVSMKMQAAQVSPEARPVFDYLLKKLEERIALMEDAPEEKVGVVEEELVQQPAVQDNNLLTPQQQAEANEFLVNIARMELSDLVRVYTTMQGVANSVPEDDKPVLEFILAKLAVRIAELKQQENN